MGSHHCVCVCVCVYIIQGLSQWAWMDICSLIINYLNFWFSGLISLPYHHAFMYLKCYIKACQSGHRRVFALQSSVTLFFYFDEIRVQLALCASVFCTAEVLKFSPSVTIICKKEHACVCQRLCQCVSMYNTSARHFFPNFINIR